MTGNSNLAVLQKWIGGGADLTGITGLAGAARSYFLFQFLVDFQRPSLIILPGREEAEKLFRELRFFMSAHDVEESFTARRLYQFSPYDISPMSGLSPHREVITNRLRSLYALISDKNPVIITSFDALFLKTLPKEAFVRTLEYLEKGEEVERETFLKRLEINGYQRVSLVEESGDYSVRGGVLDLFSPLYSLPVRLEFWGDQLESIRRFDPVSQRSQDQLKEVIILPANEIIMDKDNITRARSMGRLPNLLEYGSSFSGQEAWFNHFYPDLNTLLQYLPQNGLITLMEPHRLEHAAKKIMGKFEEAAQKFRKEAAEKGVPFPEIKGLPAEYQEITGQLENHQRLELSELEIDGKVAPRNTIRIQGRFQLDDALEIRSADKGRVSMSPLAEKIAERLEARFRVVLVSHTEQQAARLKEILENYEVFVGRIVNSWEEIPKRPGLTICLGRLAKGFIWPDIGLYVISEDEIFGSKRSRLRPKRKSKDSALTWSGFSQLKTGDFVVHEEHGIGRYAGLIKMEIEQKANDFIKIGYAGNASLYLPADRVSILRKYAGADERSPKLDQLGGRSWNIAKQKAKKSVSEIARQLVDLYALRKYRKGFAFSPPDHSFKEFEATFEYEETPDQIKAIDDVLEDMASDRPMDRLICGDVGFGKTEVAVRAAFKAVSDGKQVAVLVPTTVLAEQHYETFKKRLKFCSARVGILSRFKTRSEQKETIGQVRSGKIDVLIGTHRILQKDVHFSALGLLIIDEEQRFGVKQKEILKTYRSLLDVLAITATPVPRTLQMSMLGVRDLSIIETPPEDRHSIETYLSAYDEPLIVRAIQAELHRGGQVFFVHNRVRSIDQIAEQLVRLVPEARFAVAHGQMKEKELERTMMSFFQREIDVLICTTIIESGLDIPSANTMIINEVDRFGLAQIYQLRGRVGRSKEKAYAYLLFSKDSTLTRDAEKRLKALMDFSHLGAGLHLAMHDLKIRGGGNILGFVQSGHIAAVGYELYLNLIEKAVAELKGEEWHEDINPEINMDIPAFLPEYYIIDTDIRLNLYRRLSDLIEKKELNTMVEEIRDRFGNPPEEARNLLGLMSIRILLKNMGISRLDVAGTGLVLTFSPNSKIDIENVVQLVNNEPDRFQFLSQNKLKVKMASFLRSPDPAKVEKILASLRFH